MSKIEAKVVQIFSEEDLNTIFFELDSVKLQMISLELNDISVGDKVVLHINPSHIAISKDAFINSSYPNIISAKIVDIKKGKILSTIKIGIADNIFLEALLTTNSVEKLSLQNDEKIYALINASEISISAKL
ncbi:MAG: TOBE domain-containing protein [Campylobacteraceae bacterium]|nr:TOBE domain-containing protein [Campylobacteraceae bacterium]